MEKITTIAVDVPDERTEELLEYLRAKGINFRLLEPEAEQDETAYLLNSPKNAERLSKAMGDFKNGLGTERGLIED